MQVTLQAPTLSVLQQSVLDSSTRYNVVSGGRLSGKMTLAQELLLYSRYGAIEGYPVVVCVPDEDRLVRVKRSLAIACEPLLATRPGKSRFELVSRGYISFVVLDGREVEFYDQVSLIVVLWASEIEGIHDLCDDVLRPCLSRYKGSLWVFSKPRGLRNSFGKLFNDVRRQDGWSAHQLPSWANPFADTQTIGEARDTMQPEVFAQEYEGAIVAEPIELSASQTIIGRDETFLSWCERLSADGLKVDGMPFRLDDRPAMRFLYELIPSRIGEAYGETLVLMKCAQVGFTVMEMLAMIYMALKWMPCKIGMYLPDMKLAGIKSSERFMPIVRTIPPVYRMMMEEVTGSRKGGEGNVLIRNVGGSRFHFLWTSGKAMTESVPLDVVSFDEVQEMQIADMEKTRERMSASRIRYCLMGSTANWPDRDIHFWWKTGSQHRFWTECPHCRTHQVLDDHFPECIHYDEDSHEYRYVCHSCSGWIDDPQRGEWRAGNPDSRMVSVHFPQTLSPTISPREIIEAYHNADDLKNFWNRKLGKPYTDPSQVPVNLEILNECAKAGAALGVKWKDRASDTFMGIDQMGAFNVAIIKERLPDNRQAVIHLEYIYADAPFERCDELMVQYGVQCCVVEGLPNFNDAWSFAKRHKGRVFIAGYSDLSDEMLRWGDAKLSSIDRKTDEDSRVQYTVTLDQYKCMQTSMARFQSQTCVFPDPQGLCQDVREKGIVKRVAVLKDLAFLHFTRTALVAEKDEEQKKYRRRVVKVGIDPHTSYANMLCDVAWARAFGTTSFVLPSASDARSKPAQKVVEQMPGIPSGIVDAIDAAHRGDTCGACVYFADGVCTDRGFLVLPTDAGCLAYLGRG